VSPVVAHMTPVSPRDAVNRQILEVSEDRIRGFVRDPIAEIAQHSRVEPTIVVERLRAMLQAGVIRRVRQTLLATNLAQGALVAWKISEEKADNAFRFISGRDPFSVDDAESADRILDRSALRVPAEGHRRA
jgi:DNA-binding Lrp family transcriptional regulator